MDRNIMSEYEELIGDIARKQMKAYMKEQNMVRLVYGSIVEINGDRCKVDLGDTVVSDVLNKSGVTLKEGDTVALIDKIDSNYASCFIAYKNG